MKGDPWTLMCMQLRYLQRTVRHERLPRLIRGEVFIDGTWQFVHVNWRKR